MNILFVCHGNICRSPMAEFVMKRLVSEAGLSEQVEIESAATSTEEIGNPVYPPARRKLAEHGISCEGKTARQMTRNDYFRPHHRHGPQQPAQPETHVRRRHRPQNPPPDGLYPPPGRRGRPMVHRRLRSHLARRFRRLRGTAEIATIHRMKTPQFTERNRHNSPNEIATIHRIGRKKFSQYVENNKIMRIFAA